MIIDIIEEKIPRSVNKSTYQLLAEVYHLDSPDDFKLSTYTNFYDFLDEDMKNCNHVLVYYQDEIAVGCIYVDEYEYALSTFYESGCMHLSNLYIKPDYRNKGIADKLMKYAEKLAKEDGANMIVSDYEEDNIASAKVHEKNEYKIHTKTLTVIKEI